MTTPLTTSELQALGYRDATRMGDKHITTVPIDGRGEVVKTKTISSGEDKNRIRIVSDGMGKNTEVFLVQPDGTQTKIDRVFKVDIDPWTADDVVRATIGVYLPMLDVATGKHDISFSNDDKQRGSS